MLQGTSIEQFNKFFKNEDDCKQYLFDLKWKNGYQCRRCGCTKSYKGQTRFHQRCQNCRYDESVTAHTIFHKIKIPLFKAFEMAFRIAVRKKGMSTLELSREFCINKKSSWLFKRKTQEAMKSGGTLHPNSLAEVDVLLIRGQGIGRLGRNKTEKRKVVITTEKIKGKKIDHAYGIAIKSDGRENLDPYLDRPIDKDQVRMFTDGFERHWSSGRDFEFRQESSRRRRRMEGIDVVVMNLNGWLRGIHHHCSIRFVNGYLDEFFFRFNRRNSLTSIWHQLIERFMANPPYLYIANAA